MSAYFFVAIFQAILLSICLTSFCFHLALSSMNIFYNGKMFIDDNREYM